MNFMSAIVGTTLTGMGQERKRSSSDASSRLSKQVSADKWTKMAESIKRDAEKSRLYAAAQKPRVDYSFVNEVTDKYGNMLAQLDETRIAYVNQAKRFNLQYLIPKIKYDFSFSDTTEGERIAMTQLDKA